MEQENSQGFQTIFLDKRHAQNTEVHGKWTSWYFGTNKKAAK